MTSWAQFPRLSAYDPGAVGEGSLDPLGLSAIGDRLADRLAPGVRARMSQPRFVTLSAVGAMSCLGLDSTEALDANSTTDIVFEWLVVEALVRDRRPESAEMRRGLPGIRKATSAFAMDRRLSSATYLAGPRVFGFTGVYRPFARDARVVDASGLPDSGSYALLQAWEADSGLEGFVTNDAGTPGGQLRRDIAVACRTSLSAGACTAPRTGALMPKIASVLAPRGARRRERAELRRLVCSSDHEVRDELTSLMRTARALPVSEPDLARALLPDVGAVTQRFLNAAIAYEDAATMLDRAFRSIVLSAAVTGGQFTVSDVSRGDLVGELRKQAVTLTRRAVAAASNVDDETGLDVAAALAGFDAPMTAEQVVEQLLHRHQSVQETKGKRAWIDPVKGRWVVRGPYRDPQRSADFSGWTHPMRLATLSTFLKETS